MIKLIFKNILPAIAGLSALAAYIFGQTAFQALVTQNLGAVLVGAFFLGYFLIAASVNLALLIWVSFLDIAWAWNLILGLEVGGLLAASVFSAPTVMSGDWQVRLILLILLVIYAILAGNFLRRAYAQYRLVK